MQAAPPVLSLFLIFLSLSGWANGLCNIENGTVAKCHELEDVKYIETYDLESLKASVLQKTLSPELFSNLSSLRHLDLSGGDLEHVEPGSFHKLVNLRSLDLADNHIGYLELGAFDGLNHLHSLNLRKNNLSQLPPALARLKILRHLDVQGNPLQCNCATLKVRDLIVKRGVKISKKIICVGPNNMKGTSLLAPDATRICNLEEQDREMQRDQAYEGSGEHEEEDILDQLDADEDEDEEETNVSETPKQAEIETPYPVVTSETSTTSTTTAAPVSDVTTQETSSSTAQIVSSTSVIDSTERTTEEEDEIFFDSDDKKDNSSALDHSTEKKVIKDGLFYPVEGSGDDDGSGEGSGTGMILTDDTETSSKKEEEPTSSEDSLLDMFLGVFWSTSATPEDNKEPDLEDEHFIDASSTNEAEEEPVVTRKVEPAGLIPSSVEVTTRDSLFSPTSGIEIVDANAVHDTSKLSNVKEIEDTTDAILSEVSLSRQSKKGMGSYVVLAALLAVLAALIGFAAYKGDFCRKKRKRSDVENGTEMKDMQKALLDGGNAVQPKIASNGNAESVPLVEGTVEHEENKNRDSQPTTLESVSKPPNGTTDHTDPVKPPRRATTPQESLKDESLSVGSIDPAGSPSHSAVTRGPEGNGPPLSPGAQRVKITLQENPDSVPKTPILITRTIAGENLVKTAP